MAHSIKEFGLHGVKGGQKDIRGKGVGEGDTQVSMENLGPGIYSCWIPHAVSVEDSVKHEPFMGQGADGFDVEETGQVDVAGSDEGVGLKADYILEHVLV